jgi:hypothetical protein
VTPIKIKTAKIETLVAHINTRNGYIRCSLENVIFIWATSGIYYIIPMSGKISKLSLAALCACFLNACSIAPPGAPSLTIFSDQPERVNRYYVSSGASVEGKDCFTTVFFHLIWFGSSPVEESLLSKVLEEHNADALIDAEARYSFIFVPYIFSRSCLTISGTPAKLRGTP